MQQNIIRIIDYSEDADTSDILKQLKTIKKKNQNTWLRITSLTDTDFLMNVAKDLGIHELFLEDIMNSKHQAKFEQYADYSIIILKRIHELDSGIETTQFSMLFGKNFIITFGQGRNEKLTSYIKTIENGEYFVSDIVYDLLDQIFDEYLVFAMKYQNYTDELEDKILDNAGNYDLTELFEFKQEMHRFRRIVRPASELTELLLRPRSPLYSEEMHPYLKDLADHANRVATMAENIEEGVHSLHAIVLTQLQYRFSKTMNLMTAVSVIFLPLMVITGIYGMNFVDMPELQYKYAYPIVLVVMALIGIGMFIIFIKRKVI